MENTVITRATGLEVVAAVPYELGFEPNDAIVLVGVHPPRGRTGGMVRLPVDLARASRSGQAACSQAADLFLNNGAEGVFVIRYANIGDLPAKYDPGLNNVMGALRPRFNQLTCWQVTNKAVTELDPVGLTPIGPRYSPADLAGTRTAATFVGLGVAPKPDRSQLAMLPRVAARESAKARRAEVRALDRSMGLKEPDLVYWRLDKLSRWQHWLRAMAAAGPQSDRLVVPSSELGHMAALLNQSIGRDAVTAELVQIDTALPQRVARGEGGPDLTDAFAVSRTRPNTIYADVGARLLALVAAHQSPERRSNALALLAFQAWWYSNGPLADCWVRQAQALPFAPPLARIISDLLDAGILPGLMPGTPQQ